LQTFGHSGQLSLQNRRPAFIRYRIFGEACASAGSAVSAVSGE